MTPSNSALARIHIAKKELALTEEAYRDILQFNFQVESAKELTEHSLPEIGDAFGGRDHTTVLHAVRRIEALKAEDPMIARDLDVLLRKLRG